MTPDRAVELIGPCSTDDATVGVLLGGLRRSLAREAINDELYDDLEAAIGEFANPAPEEIGPLADRLRAATTGLVGVVPHLVRPYPVEEMQRLIVLSAEHPRPEDASGHVVRFATAMLSLLDLMGDDAL
ncbi:hypothetical protein E0L36_26960 [Streptomyces sp. AJS327]|nr:hypothetical protein [Streptomyces sp. AJS327]MBA0054356.1 hypothetical protein [Streptomyces sp. AJS327]